MAKFVYRLQKVFELRERKVKEQEERVAAAMAKVQRVQNEIDAKKNEIRTVYQHMMQAEPMMMQFHDRYIHSLNQKLTVLYEDLDRAKAEVVRERQILIKRQAELEALVKHKEKAREEWLEDEKKREMKMLDEVAGQRYFRQQESKLQEEAEDLALLQDDEQQQEDESSWTSDDSDSLMHDPHYEEQPI